MGKQIVVVMVVGLMGQKGRTDCEARWEIRCDDWSEPDALKSIRYFRNVCGTLLVNYVCSLIYNFLGKFQIQFIM